MELKKLIVKNFRNFGSVEIQLTNQNVIFGMNDVGKTNLLYALRFLLDRQIRKDGFRDSDFFQKDTNLEIEITLEIDLSNNEKKILNTLFLKCVVAENNRILKSFISK